MTLPEAIADGLEVLCKNAPESPELVDVALLQIAVAFLRALKEEGSARELRGAKEIERLYRGEKPAPVALVNREEMLAVARVFQAGKDGWLQDAVGDLIERLEALLVIA